MRYDGVPCDTEARNGDGSRSGRQRKCRRPNQAHLRRRWEEHHGKPWPPGGWACHHCDNPPCSEPRHIFVGDARANIKDAMAKGRAPAAPFGVGESHSQAKLTAELVRSVRKRVAAGETHAAVAASVRIDRAQVSRIISGKAWASVV